MAKNKAQDEGSWGKLIRDIVVILLLVLGIHSCVAKPFYIPSDSMMPGCERRPADRQQISLWLVIRVDQLPPCARRSAVACSPATRRAVILS